MRRSFGAGNRSQGCYAFTGHSPATKAQHRKSRALAKDTQRTHKNSISRRSRHIEPRFYAASTMSKWFLTIAALICIGFLLGACSTYSGFTASVADHWPRWLGGEPNDLPPRPGQPGYEEFLAHKGTTTQAASTDNATGQTAETGNPPATAQATPAGTTPDNATRQTAAPGTPPPTAQADQNVVQGGLY